MTRPHAAGLNTVARTPRPRKPGRHKSRQDLATRARSEAGHAYLLEDSRCKGLSIFVLRTFLA